MDKPMRVKIGYVSPNLSNSPYLRIFKTVIPEDVDFDTAGLELAGSSLFDLRGKKDIILKNALDLARSHHWQGVMVSGAPVELLNPELFGELCSSLNIPVAMALPSSIAALKSLSARRVLLMTPFDEPMNKLIREYLASAGIEAISPREALRHYEARDFPWAIVRAAFHSLESGRLSRAWKEDARAWQGCWQQRWY